jgi:hypothetical protein
MHEHVDKTVRMGVLVTKSQRSSRFGFKFEDTFRSESRVDSDTRDKDNQLRNHVASYSYCDTLTSNA